MQKLPTEPQFGNEAESKVPRTINGLPVCQVADLPYLSDPDMIIAASVPESQELDEGTRSQLSTLVEQEHELIATLFRQAREDMSWHEARDEAHALREETDESVAEILEEEQFEAWQESREANSPHGRRGPR